jgi:hypothetical protein
MSILLLCICNLTSLSIHYENNNLILPYPNFAHEDKRIVKEDVAKVRKQLYWNRGIATNMAGNAHRLSDIIHSPTEIR